MRRSSSRDAILSPRIVVVGAATGTARAQGRLLRSDADRIEMIATDEHLGRCVGIGAEVVVMTADEQFVGRVDAVEPHWARITLEGIRHDCLPLRRATRVPVDRPAEVSWRRMAVRRRVTVRLADISATGCGLTGLPPLRDHTVIALSTHLGQSSFGARGEVIRLPRHGTTAGVMFHELDHDARRVLSDYLAMHIGRV